MARAGSSWAAAAAAALIGRDSQRLSAAAAAPQHAVGVAVAAKRAHSAVPTTAARGLSESGELASPKRRSQTAKDTEPLAIPPVKKRRKAALPAVTCLDPTLRAKASRIGEQLRAYTPSPKIPVDHNSHFQFLVAVILSAQVNIFARGYILYLSLLPSVQMKNYRVIPASRQSHSCVFAPEPTIEIGC